MSRVSDEDLRLFAEEPELDLDEPESVRKSMARELRAARRVGDQAGRALRWYLRLGFYSSGKRLYADLAEALTAYDALEDVE